MKRLLLIFALIAIASNTFSQTWTQLQTPNTRNLYGCWFDPIHPDTGMATGWYIQSTDRLPFGFYTTNGGATISAGSLFQVYFYASSDVWFTNSYSGVVVGNGIIQTTDGGVNWNLIVDAASTQAGILENVMFANSTDGYAVGQRYDFNYTSFEGMLYKTKNAGGSWTDFTVSQEVNSENTLLHTVYSTGNGVVYAGAENQLGGSTLFKSINDGLTWTAMSFTQNIFALFFTSVDTGFAATNAGLFKTTNAGLSWNNVLTATGTLRTIQIKNGFGFTAGQYGIIYVTNDNGNTWSSVASPVIATINDLSVISPNLAYAVGEGGTFLKYTNTVEISESSNPDAFNCWFDNNNRLTIKWNNDSSQPTLIDLIALNGSVVKNITAGNINVGVQSVKIDLANFTNGVYVVKFIQGNKIQNKKVVIVK